MDSNDFSAAGIRARLQKAREAKLVAEEAQRTAHAAEQTALREAFEAQQLPPDAMARVIAMVERAIRNGQKEAQVFQFPSDFMKDDGRSITSQYGDWTQQLTGAASRAYAFFEKELAPRGFVLRPRIVTYKEGIPGDVGFFLAWEELPK
ncbi:hypothetical protein [Roseococcus pinisoli]|uniref:Histidine kinase n=1 Tax=Roseococcus pinisoli TaxID=2835040 RepID=A0ABS5QF92_9PROT|nr:hypothetical protein [Roseococcus pinisoli]MBS7812229.1 hypothetical protein [Roseococcus pinisoli]